MENREIKFRGFSKTDKIFVYGSLNTYKDASAIITNFEGTQSWVVDPKSVGQYVGLKDKNGVEIYEGDIVKGGGINDIIKKKFKISTIVYRGKGFCVKDEDFGYEGEGLWYWEKIEVIGNVYQNSDLLK